MLHLWPVAPSPESFKSDVPNEGLLLGYSTDDVPGISSQKEECQGHSIVTPEDTENLHWIRPSFGCTRDPQYLDAYRIIMEELAECWEGDPPYNWDIIIDRIKERLYTAGWCDIEWHEYDDENGDHCYWREVRS